MQTVRNSRAVNSNSCMMYKYLIKFKGKLKENSFDFIYREKNQYLLIFRKCLYIRYTKK